MKGWLCAGGVAAAGWLAAAAQRPGSERYGEAVVVREADVITEPPPRRGDADDARRWLVLEDGLEREVVRVEGLEDGDTEPWDLVVWLDSALATPAVRLHGVAALSRLAAELAARGPVALWSDGREVEMRAEARGVADLLADAAVAGARPDPTPDREAGAAATVADAIARLLLFVDARPRSGPGIVFLPAPPLVLDAADEIARAAQERLDEVANVLAGYGWTILVLPFRVPSDEIERAVDERSEYERWREDVLGTDPVENFRYRWPRRRAASSVERIETQIDPSLAPWRRFVASGGGWVVDSEKQLRAALGALAGRRRLWYRTSAPLDGSLRRVEVRWRATGQATRAQTWRRAGTPEAVATARLLDLFVSRGSSHAAAAVLDERAGRTGLDSPWWRLPGARNEFGRLPLETRRADGGRLRLEIRGEVPEAPAADRRARLSCLRAPSGPAIEVSHALAPWSSSFEIDCADAVAVAVEDLATGAWGTRWLDRGETPE